MDGITGLVWVMLLLVFVLLGGGGMVLLLGIAVVRGLIVDAVVDFDVAIEVVESIGDLVFLGIFDLVLVVVGLVVLSLLVF